MSLLSPFSPFSLLAPPLSLFSLPARDVALGSRLPPTALPNMPATPDRTLEARDLAGLSAPDRTLEACDLAGLSPSMEEAASEPPLRDPEYARAASSLFMLGAGARLVLMRSPWPPATALGAAALLVWLLPRSACTAVALGVAALLEWVLLW